MNKRKFFVTAILIFATFIIVLFLNVFIQRKFIQKYTYTQPCCLDFVAVLYYTQGNENVGNPTKEKAMEKYFDLLMGNPLFAGISREELNSMLGSGGLCRDCAFRRRADRPG